MKKSRNSTIEILRILSMLLITLHHFSLWGQGQRSDQLILNGKLIESFQALAYLPLGDIGVYSFVMITGFYLGNKIVSDKYVYSKIKNMYVEVVFYDLLFLSIGLSYHLPLDNFPNLRDPLVLFNSIPNVMMSFFPIIYNHYWFVTAFVILLLLIPYLNRLLNLCTRLETLYLVSILIVVCGVFPLFNNNVASESVGLGVILTSYIIGSYCRRFILKNKKNLLIGFLLLLINILVIYMVMFYDITVLKYRYIKIYTGFFAMMASTGLFLIFVNIKPFWSPIINSFSSHIFSVYLITENIFVIKILWSIFNFHNTNDLVMVNVYGFISVILIMILSFFIDTARCFLFSSLIFFITKIRSLFVVFNE